MYVYIYIYIYIYIHTYIHTYICIIALGLLIPDAPGDDSSRRRSRVKHPIL